VRTKKKESIGVDLSESMWAKLTFVGYTPYVCAKSLVADLVSELWDKAELEDVGPIDEIAIDLPGPIVVDRKMLSIKIDTLLITMPYSDVESFCDQLASAKPLVLSSGSTCFRLVAFGRSIIMTAEQRFLLAKAMSDILPIAREEKLRELRLIAAAMSHVIGKRP